MNKRLIVPLVGIVIVLAGIFLYSRNTEDPAGQNTSTGATATSTVTQQDTAAQPVMFENPKKSAHYESNTPAQAAILAAVPLEAVINFNFDLHPKSTITVTSNGTEYSTGTTTVDENKLTMRRAIAPDAPDGTYTVTYNACWPDGSCHDGSFQFAISRKEARLFTDYTEQNEVTVTMKEIAFKPFNIRVKAGTTITWINNDDVEHYVNTDSHPAHTYYPAQNSKALKKGDQFRLTFDKPGIYPYHCSSHADTMTGAIIVEAV